MADEKNQNQTDPLANLKAYVDSFPEVNTDEEAKALLTELGMPFSDKPKQTQAAA